MLLNSVENAASDSFNLYYGLFMYNKSAMEQLERLDLALEALRFGKSKEGGHRRPMLANLPKNGIPFVSNKNN